MGDGIADLQVRGDRELDERSYDGKRRGDGEMHVADRSPADEPTVGQDVDGPRRRSDSDSSAEVSHAANRRINRQNGLSLAICVPCLAVSRETVRGSR